MLLGRSDSMGVSEGEVKTAMMMAATTSARSDEVN